MTSSAGVSVAQFPSLHHHLSGLAAGVNFIDLYLGSPVAQSPPGLAPYVFLTAIAQMRAGILTFQRPILFTIVARLLIAPINQPASSALWIEATDAASGRIRELLAEQPRLVDGQVVKHSA
jgi:hypothetical protein